MADLRSILLDLCRRAGIESAVDATDASGRVPGMVLASRMTVRAALESLQQAHAFNIVESGGSIFFRTRRHAPVATITGSDLIPDGDGSLLRVTRRQETELPYQVDVLYAGSGAAHQTSTQSARRGTGAARGVFTVELPLALRDGQARRIAERLLYEAWIGRDLYKFQLSAEHARLEPGDVVSLDLRGRVQRLRISATEMTAAAIQVTAVADDSLAEESDSAGGVPGIRQSTRRQLAPSALFALDLPLLRDADDGAGWYVAASYDATAPGKVWRGARLMQSNDGGSSFADVLTLTSPAIWGVCESVLAVGPTAYWDELSTLRVRLKHGELESRTAQAVLQGGNAALVGCEVIQYRQAVPQGDGTYLLSGLLRGRRGTEHHAETHSAGEMFLLLRAADLRRIDAGQETVGAELWLKAVTLGTYAEDAEAQVFFNAGAGLRPWSVAHPRGIRDGGSGDWTITWTRRSRLGGAWIDHADVALGEEAERYEVDVLGPGGERRRTVSVNAPVAVYSAAMQLQDFGAPQQALRVCIHQISAAVGRGIGREVTL
jgi:hypothetical protein